MKVTLARAMKERSRLAGKLKKNFEILQKKNSVIEGSHCSYDLRAIMTQCEELETRLIAVRKAIAQANAGIAAKIVEKEELKSMITYLKEIDTYEGYRTSYEEKVCMSVEFSGPEISAKMDALQQRVEQLQDEIDEFNAIQKVEIPNA